MKNFWADRFAAILKLSDLEIEGRIRVPGAVVQGLHDLPASSAVERLRKALQAIYEPTPSGIDAIRRVLGRAHGHALVRYPSIESFTLGMYADKLDFEPLPATCITGMAGLGKSQLIEAMWRLLPGPSTLKLPDGTEVPLIAGASFKIEQKSSPAAVGAALYRALGVGAEDRAPKAIKPEALRKRCYVRGGCFAIADEMQFMTSSADANALATKVLLSLTYLGVPATYVANFSLLHRLIRRNHEERQRLLTDVIRLDPESPDSPAMIAMLKGWCDVADGAFGFDPAKAAERFDAFSGGSRRAMRELPIISYRRKRERSPKSKAVVLSMADLEATYLSQEFAVFRRDAEMLLQQRVTGKMADKTRKDLWCPIQPVVQAKNVGQANAERELQGKVDAQILKGSMTPAEVKGVAEIERAFNPAGNAAVEAKNPRRKSAKITLAGMLARVRT